MAPSSSPGSPKKSQSPTKTKRASVKREAPPAGGDIRSFFSQGSNGGPSRPAPTSHSKVGSGNRPISIDDSDEDSVKVKPAKTKSPAKKPTTSKHFATSSKPTVKRETISLDDTPSPPPKPVKPQSRGSTGMKRRAVDPDSSSEEDVKPAAKRQSIGGRSVKKANYVESSSSEEEEEEVEVKPKPKAQSSKAPALNGRAKGKAKKEEDDLAMDVDDESSEESESSDEDSEDEVPKKKTKAKAPAPPKKTTPKKSPAKKPAAKPAAKKTPKKKDEKAEEKPAIPEPDFRGAAKERAEARAAGERKEIPEGQLDCLAGLTFVFTGELETLSREEAQELAKRYSGRVTGAPSKATSYVVLGENAGPKKLETIKTHKLQTLNEDEFLELIRMRSPAQLDEKTIKAREKAEKDVEKQAKEMEKREKEEEAERRRKEKALGGTGVAVKKVAPLSAQLWTTKYAPTNLKEICGNKAPVERLGNWLAEWQKNAKFGFKKPGKDGMGLYRAVLISGPPGIGKTTSAHLVAKLNGYNPIELNASDARSKKLIENGTNIDNTSLDGFLAGKGMQSTMAAGDVRVDSRTCLIMDEVDGMSAGDRGGVGALNALIKKTKIPMILICNDRTLQKMKPLMSTTFNMTFRRPGPPEIRARILSILFKEKLKIPSNVVDELVKGANSDIRQVLNMLSTFKLAKNEMDFDEGKRLLKINEKNMLLTPFTITEKLYNPYAFSKTNKDTLNEKMELYFHDFSMVPLFMEEHYLKTQPVKTNNCDEREKTLKHLELVSKAADSISDGDLVDRMVRGSEQHWSLLPLHAVASTVRPAFFTYGPMRPQGGGGFGSWGPSFPQWLGQNSKQTKLQRLLTDIQIRMRLRVSGSRQEIRETYMPLLATKLVMPLVEDGVEAVDDVISTMDDYFLGKEDWDAFVELGVDSMKEDMILKKIPTATKSAFTRQYNKADHPIAFHKGDMFASAKKKIADIGPAPDNEDVVEEDEAPQDDEEESAKAEDPDEEVNDVSKDKLIKAVGAGGKGKGKGKAAGGTGKGKKK